MTSFAYTLEEYFDIIQALGTKRTPKPTPTQIWDSPLVKDVKARFKAHKRIEQDEQCCYCQRSIRGEFNMVLDIEHVLPKSIFAHCIFDLWNLAVSCRRCNMQIKGNRIDFLNTDLRLLPKIEKSQLFKREHYKFAHPNLVDVHQHLFVLSAQCGPRKIFSYKIITAAGRYTYEFFRLQELETESMNTAQGLPQPRNEVLYEAIRNLERTIYT